MLIYALDMVLTNIVYAEDIGSSNDNSTSTNSSASSAVTNDAQKKRKPNEDPLERGDQKYHTYQNKYDFNDTLKNNQAVKDYIKKATELNIVNSNEWRYSLFILNGDNTSIVYDDNFFLSTTHSPQDELTADIVALVSDYQNSNSIDENSFVCRFPARTKFLTSIIEVKEASASDSQFDKIKCGKTYVAYTSIKPTSVKIAFPAESGTTPSSVFGHLFIRLDTDNSTENNIANSKALAVTFAANVTEKPNPLVYMYKGVTGVYSGPPQITYYHNDVKYYTTYNGRDMLIYGIKLNETETERLIDRVWELHNTNINYYYFGVNCASIVQYLVGSVTYEPKLMNKYFIASPHLILQKLDETSTIKYESSIVASYKIALKYSEKLSFSQKVVSNNIISHLDKNELEFKNFILEFVNNDNYTKEYKAQSIDLAIMFAEINVGSDKLTKEEIENYQANYYTLTTERRRLQYFSKENPQRQNVTIRADITQGHKENRIGLFYYAKTSNNKENNNEWNDDGALIQISPGYHTELDSNTGYSIGKYQEFFNIGIEYSKKHKKYDLGKLTIAKIQMINDFRVLKMLMSYTIDAEYADKPNFLHTNNKTSAYYSKQGYIKFGSGISRIIDQTYYISFLGGIEGVVYNKEPLASASGHTFLTETKFSAKRYNYKVTLYAEVRQELSLSVLGDNNIKFILNAKHNAFYDEVNTIAGIYTSQNTGIIATADSAFHNSKISHNSKNKMEQINKYSIGLQYNF